MGSDIEWTDETWNPTVGCSRVSPGCDGCYAIGVAHRAMQPAHRGLTVMSTQSRGPRGGVLRDARPDWTGEVRLLPDRLDTPLHWRRPRRVFVDSMSDLFHPDVPESFVVDVFVTMARARRHTFQVLTKRPQRMAQVLNDPKFGHELYYGLDEHFPEEHDAGESMMEVESGGDLPNVWLGTSVENQRYADLRIPHLLATPAAVRFLSIEPLLGPVDLSPWTTRIDHMRAPGVVGATSYEMRGIDWVIVGGESGPGARPMEREWVDSIVEQCKAASVAVFVKQLGTVLGGKHHQDVDTFPETIRVREYPA